MASFKIIAADGTERSVKGYRHAEKPAGTRHFARDKVDIDKLPAKVDLRQFLTPVEDQGETNSCAAHATAGAYEYLLKRYQGDDAYGASRLFIYYNGRYVEDSDKIEDEGATLSNIIDGLKQYGACSEPTWSFAPESINEEPEQAAYDEAAGFVVEEAEYVPLELEAWKTALAAGHPIIFALELYDSFDKQRKPGLVPIPSKNATSRETHSGHAMLCVGYSDPDQVFIVRNSWGSEWGDEGYCYIPYAYVMDEEQNYDDSWIVKRVEALPQDETTWSEDEESVLDDVSTVLSAMSEEDYAALLDAMGEHPFERRLAHIFLSAANADGELSDEEVELVSEYLAPILEQTGGQQNPKGILKFARKHLDDADLMEESIDLIGEHFDKPVLTTIATQIRAAAAADGLSQDEREWIDALVARWEVELPELEE